jgi:hypothetical protein
MNIFVHRRQKSEGEEVMMKILCEHSGWTLFDLGKPANGWISLKLIAEGRRPKNNWWLSWNGERLAKGRDCKLLIEHHPEIHAWVIGALQVAPHEPHSSCFAANSLRSLVKFGGGANAYP